MKGVNKFLFLFRIADIMLNFVQYIDMVLEILFRAARTGKNFLNTDSTTLQPRKIKTFNCYFIIIHSYYNFAYHITIG